VRGGVAKEMTGSVLGIISSVLGTIVVFIAAAQAMSPALFGEFAFTYAMISLLGLLFDFGYPVSFLKDIRKAEDGKRAELPRRALGVKLTMFALLTPIAVAIPFILGANLWVALTLWAGIALVSIGHFFSTALRAIALHAKDALNLFLANLVGLGIACIAYFTWPEALAFACVFVGIGIVYCALSLRLWRQHFRVGQGRLFGPDTIAEFRKNGVYVLDAMGRRSFGFVDVAILGFFAPFETVGLYQAGQKLTQCVSIFAQPFNNVLLPRLSRSADKADGFEKQARIAFLGQCMFGVGAGVVLAVLGPPALTLLFSAEFAPASDLLVLFAILITVRYATSAITISKTAQGYIKQRLYANLLSVAVLVSIGPILTYFVGAQGLLLGLILSALLGALALILLTKQRPQTT